MFLVNTLSGNSPPSCHSVSQGPIYSEFYVAVTTSNGALGATLRQWSSTALCIPIWVFIFAVNRNAVACYCLKKTSPTSRAKAITKSIQPSRRVEDPGRIDHCDNESTFQNISNRLIRGCRQNLNSVNYLVGGDGIELE